MTRNEMIAIVLAVTLASIIVRILVINPAVGAQTNKLAAQLF